MDSLVEIFQDARIATNATSTSISILKENISSFIIDLRSLSACEFMHTVCCWEQDSWVRALYEPLNKVFHVSLYSFMKQLVSESIDLDTLRVSQLEDLLDLVNAVH